MNLPKRFWDKVFINEWDINACWEWLGCLVNGYGIYRLDGKNLKAHRLAFLDFGGLLTAKRPLALHICNNKQCVRPAHLYAGTPAENAKDAVNAGAHPDTKKTHCRQGHLYDRVDTRGARGCRMCHNEQARNSYWRSHVRNTKGS